VQIEKTGGYKQTTTRETGGFVFTVNGRAANDHTKGGGFVLPGTGETK